MNRVVRQTALILRNDLRLLWRPIGASKLGVFLSGSMVAVVFGGMNAIAIMIFLVARPHPTTTTETLVWLFFAFLTVATAVNQAVDVLFERADFDLLLSSPVAPRAILLARLAAMTVGAGFSTGFLLLPLITAAMLGVSWRYGAAYLVWVLLSCTFASLAIGGTLLLVRWIGPRRARIWAQVIATLLATAIYFLIQGQHLVSAATRVRLLHGLTAVLEQSGLNGLARAGRGEIVPLLTLTIVATMCVFATIWLLGRTFVTGIQDAGSALTPRRPIPNRRRTFHAGIGPATFFKELRLIARDPLLIAQLLPTIIYIVPALAGFGRLGATVVISTIAVLIANQFSFALAAVAASGEEGWDLIRMSPMPESRLRWAKLFAATTLPVALAGVLSVFVAFLGHPWLALLTVFYSAGCGGASAWLQVTKVKPSPRRDILRRGRGRRDFARSLSSILLMFVAAGGLGCVATDHLVAGMILLGITAIAIIACFTLVEVQEAQSWPESASPNPAAAL